MGSPWNPRTPRKRPSFLMSPDNTIVTVSTCNQLHHHDSYLARPADKMRPELNPGLFHGFYSHCPSLPSPEDYRPSDEVGKKRNQEMPLLLFWGFLRAHPSSSSRCSLAAETRGLMLCTSCTMHIEIHSTCLDERVYSRETLIIWVMSITLTALDHG